MGLNEILLVLIKKKVYTITNAINLLTIKNFPGRIFQQYLKDCLVSIKQWDGIFPKTDKNEIVKSQQTCDELKITASSITTGSRFFFHIKSDNFI